MGLIISHKNNEKRRALLPKEIKRLQYPDYLFIEEGYGEAIGIEDSEYQECGCHIVSRKKALACDIICDVKLGNADYLDEISGDKLLFGWAHAAQCEEFTSACLNKNFSVMAWEYIYEDGRYLFYRNREVAGEAGVLQALCHIGKMPYECKVAIIGNGQTAKGAMRILHGLGANVDVYNRKLEKLFLKKKHDYDVIVNCVLWDLNRDDHLVYREDLKKMKKGSLIIDISCDPHKAIETSHPTTIDNPVYEIDGIKHYAVDNTPAMFPYTVSKVLSKGLVHYIDILIEEKSNKHLKPALIIDKGHLLDEEVIAYRKHRGLFIK